MARKYKINAMPNQASREVCELLRSVETATVGHFRDWGFCHREIQPLLRGKSIVGTAVTLGIAGSDSTLLHHAVGLLRPGDVLLIDRLGDDRHACWGGGITAAVKASGAFAGVVDGPATDLAEIEAADFPVWARGIAPITTRVHDLGGRMNVPISIGGAVVHPGDVVLADDNGVLILPQDEAEQEARRALDLQERGVDLVYAVQQGKLPLGSLTGASDAVARDQRGEP